MGAERGGSGPGKVVIRDSMCGRFERVLREKRLETVLFIEIRFRGFTAGGGVKGPAGGVEASSTAVGPRAGQIL